MIDFSPIHRCTVLDLIPSDSAKCAPAIALAEKRANECIQCQKSENSCALELALPTLVSSNFENPFPRKTADRWFVIAYIFSGLQPTSSLLLVAVLLEPLFLWNIMLKRCKGKSSPWSNHPDDVFITFLGNSHTLCVCHSIEDIQINYSGSNFIICMRRVRRGKSIEVGFRWTCGESIQKQNLARKTQFNRVGISSIGGFHPNLTSNGPA